MGDWQLLPSFCDKYTPQYGEDMLKRLGTTMDYSDIMNKHRSTRILSRHAGAAAGLADRQP